MSQENVETVRQALEAIDRRDRSAWLALYDPDLEVVPDPGWPEPGAIRGREAGWDFYLDVADTLLARAAYADLVDAGPDKVVVHRGIKVRGKASGADVEFDYSVVGTFREGKIVREQWFADRDEAPEAAGLRE